MTDDAVTTHIAFADESHWNKGRYRSICTITLPIESFPYIEGEVRAIVEQMRSREFKWEDVRGAEQRQAAIDLCEVAVRAAVEGMLRVDVLCWDITDSRHGVYGRDDKRNFAMMYHKLFKNVLRERWPDDSTWRLYPDENGVMDWNNLQSFLEAVDTDFPLRQDLLTDGKVTFYFKRRFGILAIIPSASCETPMIQLADLFAGLALFSRASYDAYVATRGDLSPQLVLPLYGDTQSVQLSNRERERCWVLYEFNEMCKGQKLGVSLDTRKMLWTPDPTNPMNFWWYEPQCEDDKAPVRGQH
ncbi:MAG: hypothetical protein M0Z94_04145 [Dehalococcoidales bacterium]|nr:hypothetical protein [Dehalococcoidales bacterium]